MVDPLVRFGVDVDVGIGTASVKGFGVVDSNASWVVAVIVAVVVASVFSAAVFVVIAAVASGGGMG